MSRPLSLSAYLTLRRGPVAEGQDSWTVGRPDGPLLWAHCCGAGHLAALGDLVARLRADGDRLAVLATVPPGDGAALSAAPGGIIVQRTPSDKPRPARAFLDHWRPDVLLGLGLPLHPVLLNETQGRPLARFLVGTDGASPLIEGGTWIPGMARSTLALFDETLATDGAAAAHLRRAGADAGRIRLVGPFEPGGPVLPHVESDRRDLTAALGTRPVWHAAQVPQAELATVIEAHRLASLRSHRLLLILSTDAADTAAGLCQSAGLRHVSRIAGGDPDDATNVLLTDTSEPGLWFRVAPLSYLGGTLCGAPSRDPFEAAGLGSAVLHGPQISAHLDHFGLLAAAGAVRGVARPEDLGHALETLMAPDKTAAIAHAAWGVTSDGAETGNRIAAMIRDALDQVGG